MDSSGAKGEQAAAVYLETRGYTVTFRNYKSRFGEVDIIAEDETFLVFVEVKTRKARFAESGLYAVDARKQDRLRRTAELYLAAHGTEKQPRFDVITVAQDKGCYRIEQHIENAF